jgi:hypothetical protein
VDSGLEGRLCMLGGLVKGHGGIVGEGRARKRTCIQELDAQEFVARGLSDQDLKIGPQPLRGVVRCLL